MENTTNSLSDINNDGQKFNRLLSSTEISNSVDTNKLNLEKTEITAKINNTSDKGTDRKALLNKLSEKDSQIDKNNSNKPNTNIDIYANKSLFDRNANIDFARFINNDGTVQANWIEYNLSKKDSANSKDNPFIINNTANINTPVTYNDSSLREVEGLDVPDLVKWSEKYPALQLRFQDFAYCKLLSYYPNNRLIILRRYKGGIPDNLFDYYNPSQKVEFTQPLATMITWLKPDDNIIDMSFNEGWGQYTDGFVETLKKSMNDFIGKNTSKPENTSFGFGDMITSLALDTILNINKQDGTKFSRSISGNPNLIKEAQIRKTGGEGLESSINFNLKFEYEFRYINGIDSSIVMLDLMSNAMRMGTSESEFRYNVGVPDALLKFVNGDMSDATNIFSKKISDITNQLKANFDKIASNAKSTAADVINDPVAALSKIATDTANKSVDFTFSRYREALKASLAVDTGIASGVWHVQIGNPKAPIVSCGDLIIKSSKLTLGKELGYNDFPNSFKVEYSLASARSRGRQELARIFNSGRGRLYVYPQSTDNPDYDSYEPLIPKN